MGLLFANDGIEALNHKNRQKENKVRILEKEEQRLPKTWEETTRLDVLVQKRTKQGKFFMGLG